MARLEQSRGACAYCGRTMTRGGMARHLRTCEARRDRVTAADQQSGAREAFFHLQVQDAYGGPYWLHLEMAGSATLKALDRYLRNIWLECCGHLSQFSIGDAWQGRKVPFTAKAGRVFRPGAELIHIYDFGTSSETRIKVVDERSGRAATPHPIALMARNEPPAFSCMECDKDAAWLCMECIYEEDREGMLCNEHAAEHPHDAYGEPFPVVNSPRLGMCGYTGPADPPY